MTNGLLYSIKKIHNPLLMVENYTPNVYIWRTTYHIGTSLIYKVRYDSINEFVQLGGMIIFDNYTGKDY